ncbi:MAG: hypothetical protein JF567_10190 [Xanthomonadales bacterium]|nr:hypothetical protein [Xanthomonadales bacterium]
MSLFLAWMPAGTTLEQLCALRDDLRAGDTTGSWTAWRKDAQLHMTLRHLADEAPPAKTGLREAIDGMVAKHVQIDVQFDRIEAWPPALVVRTSPNDALAALLKDLDSTAIACGYPRMRAQTPHLTLAYPPRGIRGNTLGVPAPVDPGLLPIPTRIRNISVVQTETGRGYRQLASWSLRPS